MKNLILVILFLLVFILRLFASSETDPKFLLTDTDGKIKTLSLNSILFFERVDVNASKNWSTTIYSVDSDGEIISNDYRISAKTIAREMESEGIDISSLHRGRYANFSHPMLKEVLWGYEFNSSILLLSENGEYVKEMKKERMLQNIKEISEFSHENPIEWMNFNSHLSVESSTSRTRQGKVILKNGETFDVSRSNVPKIKAAILKTIPRIR